MNNLDEYLAAIQDVIVAITSRSKSIVSFFVHGSVVRGTIRPYKSDIVDGMAIFDDCIFDSETKFVSALEAMTSACERLVSYPCPSHPFHYYTTSEVAQYFPASLLPIYASNVRSRCDYGIDCRERLGTSEVSTRISGFLCLSFFRSAQQLGRYLRKRRLDTADKQYLSEQLLRYRKVVPLLVCMAYGLWVEHTEANTIVRSLLPEIDFSILYRIDALVESSGNASQGELRSILEESLLLFAEIHDRVWVEFNRKQQTRSPTAQESR
jgi:hypothetical protein